MNRVNKIFLTTAALFTIAATQLKADNSKMIEFAVKNQKPVIENVIATSNRKQFVAAVQNEEKKTQAPVFAQTDKSVSAGDQEEQQREKESTIVIVVASLAGAAIVLMALVRYILDGKCGFDSEERADSGGESLGDKLKRQAWEREAPERYLYRYLGSFFKYNDGKPFDRNKSYTRISRVDGDIVRDDDS